MTDHSIDDLLYELRYASPNELGFVVAITSHCRNFLLKEYGLDCHKPEDALAGKGDPLELIDQFIGELKARNSDHTDLIAVGMTVWWHTIGASANHAKRPKVRSLWMELQRGVPYARDRALELKKLFGHDIDTRGSEHIPKFLVLENAD